MPVLFQSNIRVRDAVVRVVGSLVYGLILGAEFSRTNSSRLDFGPKKRFRPMPLAPWVSFWIHDTTDDRNGGTKQLSMFHDVLYALRDTTNPVVAQRTP